MNASADAVQAHFLKARQVARTERHEEMNGAPGQGQADRAAGNRQPRAFGQEVAGDAAAARAQGAAHGNLPLPGLGTDQEQVRDVGARDEQHQTDRGEQRPQGRRDAAHRRLDQRFRR